MTVSVYVPYMKIAANLIVALVAIEHLGILVLEMFFWDHPVGYRIFGTTPDVASASAVLAMNQGLYNGFIAAGLIWGLVASLRDVKTFFLLCIVAAGIFGGITAKTTILFTQAMPSLIGLGLLLVSSDRK